MFSFNKKINLKSTSDEIIGFLNDFDSDEYNLVMVYNSLRNNSEEIYYVKCILTLLYFPERLSSEYIEFDSSAIFYNIEKIYMKISRININNLRAPII
ncbi:hypothetical protein Q5M85_21185 [Paraclostridium bifermentans]|nr:hypothetical protein [Paraclostridium bifermentans]